MWIVLIIGTMGEGFGQDKQTLDSLKIVLPQKQGAEWLAVCHALVGEHIVNRMFVEALPWAEKGDSVATVLGDSVRMVEFKLLQASIFRRSGKMEQAAVLYNEILPLARRVSSPGDIAITLNAYALTLEHMSEYKSSLLYFIESVKYHTLANDQKLDMGYTNIGYVFFKLNNSEKALHYYLMAMRVKEETHSTHALEVVYNNIALCYCALNNYVEAEKYVKKTLEYCSGASCEPEITFNQYYTLGVIAKGLDRLDDAKLAFQKSYEIAAEQGSEKFKSENTLHLGRLENDAGNYETALHYLTISLSSAHTGRYRKLLAETYEELATAYQGLKRSKEAFASREMYLHYHDSIFNEDLVHSVVASQVDFEQARNKTVLAIRDASSKRQEIQHQFMVIVAVLLVAVIGLFLWDIRSRKRENGFLEQAVAVRTRELSERVQGLERSGVARSAWEARIHQATYAGISQLKGLSDLIKPIASGKIRDSISALR